MLVNKTDAHARCPAVILLSFDTIILSIRWYFTRSRIRSEEVECKQSNLRPSVFKYTLYGSRLEPALKGCIW